MMTEYVFIRVLSAPWCRERVQFHRHPLRQRLRPLELSGPADGGSEAAEGVLHRQPVVRGRGVFISRRRCFLFM